MSTLKKMKIFFTDVRYEMKKVTWSSREEIVASTVAVIVSSVILGFFLGISDFVLSYGIKPVLQGQPNIMSGVTLLIFAGLVFWVYQVIQDG